MVTQLKSSSVKPVSYTVLLALLIAQSATTVSRSSITIAPGLVNALPWYEHMHTHIHAYIHTFAPTYMHTYIPVDRCLLLQRNYPFFIGFISSSTLLCLYVFVFSWVHLLQQEGSVWRIMAHDILAVVLIVYCFIAVWFVGGLTAFHIYLMCSNQVASCTSQISEFSCSEFNVCMHIIS